MSKKKNRDLVGEAMAEALNAAFEFGMAHQQALDANNEAAMAQAEAVRTSHELQALIVPRKKSELN